MPREGAVDARESLCKACNHYCEPLGSAPGRGCRCLTPILGLLEGLAEGVQLGEHMEKVLSEDGERSRMLC